MDNSNAAVTASANVSGEVTTITFRNEDTGYSVLRIDVRGQRDPVTVVGTCFAKVGETIQATGEWKQHASFGKQVVATNITVERPTSGPAMARYLAGSGIKGIGPKTADRIVAMFGDNTANVLDNEPMRLAKVTGISLKRAETIAEAWQTERGERQALIQLAELGIFGGVALRVVRKYGGAAMDVVTKFPYRLTAEVRGVGFATADAIAQKLGMPLDAEDRIVAGLRHTITTSIGMGHCGMGKAKFLAAAGELLSLPPELVRLSLEEQIAYRSFIVQATQDGQRIVFDKRLHDAEKRIAHTLTRAVRQPPPWSMTAARATSLAAEAERYCGMTLAPAQRDAVSMALSNSISILTGGPGTGKTSTLKVMLEAFRRAGARVVLGAPTGKAAKRMAESTGMEAATLARLTGMGRNPSDPLPEIQCSILIIDEASMVDVPLLDRVFKCLEPNAAVLFVGDVDQLPSVGAGRVLGDMIASGKVNTTRLTEIFRQAAESAIIRNAHRINAGDGLEPESDAACDFYFIPAASPEDIAARITALVTQHIPSRIGIPANEVQVLSPMRKSGTGTEALNATLQQALNPTPAAHVLRNGRRYGVGDRVLQLVNNYDLGVMNGESGIITAVRAEDDLLIVDVDGTKVSYPFRDLDQLDLAYAMTVHKSQGSQFSAVVIPVTTQHFMMLQRPIIYTAITRASRFCVLVGQRDALKMAIANTRTEPRITALQRLLEG